MAATEGSHSVRGKSRHGLGWLPWAALLLIVALAVAVVLIVANVSDENDEPGVDVTDDEQSRTGPERLGPPGVYSVIRPA